MVGDSTDGTERQRVPLTDGGSEGEMEEGGDEEESAEQAAETEETEEEGGGASEDESEQQAGVGDGEGATVLHLDLEGLSLNLLGLELDLSEIELDLSAVPGEKRLLGNLLDAVAGLLDRLSLPDVGGAVDDARAKVGDELREIGSDLWEELDLATVLDQALSGLVDEFFGDLVDTGDGGDEGGENGEEGDGSEA